MALVLFFSFLSKVDSMMMAKAQRPHTQYFLDTAFVHDWERYLPLGIFYGITTNPVLLEKAHIPHDITVLSSLAKSAIDDFKVEVFMLQTWGEAKSLLIENGLRLQSISGKVVVKVPLTREGIEAAAVLIEQGVRVCMTACYAPHQVFTSVGLGAEYVAPYLGRISDGGTVTVFNLMRRSLNQSLLGRNGMEEVVQMQRVVEGLKSDTRVFVASIRNVQQLAELAAAGLHTFTFSPRIAEGLVHEPLSIAAASDFEMAANPTLRSS